MASVIAAQGDTIDSLCWAYYGRTAGVTEQVLEANPTLADGGPIIAHGTRVELPDLPVQAPERAMVNLWD